MIEHSERFLCLRAENSAQQLLFPSFEIGNKEKQDVWMERKGIVQTLIASRQRQSSHIDKDRYKKMKGS